MSAGRYSGEDQPQGLADERLLVRAAGGVSGGAKNSARRGYEYSARFLRAGFEPLRGFDQRPRFMAVQRFCNENTLEQLRAPHRSKTARKNLNAEPYPPPARRVFRPTTRPSWILAPCSYSRCPSFNRFVSRYFSLCGFAGTRIGI